MISTPRSSLWIVAITFLLAFVLTLLPMPEWADWLRPSWVLLVLIYWNLTIPYHINIGTAWFLGLLLDVLNNAPLGEHALAMTIVAYIVVKMHARIRMFPLLQQGLCVWLLVLLYLFVIYCIEGFIHEAPQNKLYWLSSVISMLLWPWLVSFFKNLSHKMVG